MSANASTAGSLIWSADGCTGFTAQPILPNVTNSRVCGLQTLNSTVLRSCCNGPVETYACWSYCSAITSQTTFARCVNETSSGSFRDVFCQSNSSSTLRQTASSAANSGNQRPSTSFVLLVACICFAFFLGPTNAHIIRSVDDGLTKRTTDSNCTFQETRRFVQLGATEKVSANFIGAVGIGVPVNSDITRNNRTVNSRSAAEGLYDAFFDVLSRRFGRQFPAMSSIEVFYEIPLLQGVGGFVGWTPFQWCVNGTATGCKNSLGDDSTLEIVACGPVFVTDNNSTEPQASAIDENAIIQGPGLKPILTPAECCQAIKIEAFAAARQWRNGLRKALVNLPTNTEYLMIIPKTLHSNAVPRHSTSGW